MGTLRVGGAENQLRELVRRLDRDRFEPHLILFRPPPEGRIRGIIENVHSLASSRRWPDYLEKDAFKTPFFLWSAYRILSRTRPHILHAFLGESPTIIGCTAARLARVPVIISSRRGSPRLYRHRIAVTVAERCALRSCHYLLGNSLAMTQEFSEFDEVPAPKTGTIYNGVDTGLFRPGRNAALRAAYGWDDTHFVIGIVANFRPEKRYLDFVAAAAVLSARFPHTRYLIVGQGGIEREKTLAAIAEVSIEDRFQILDTGEPELDAYPAMDAYLCCSATEGFSNSILEAMASGIPVIATNVGGNMEAVRDGIDGFLVPCGDVRAMADALSRLITEGGLKQQMTQAARQRAEDTFSFESMVQAHEELYLRLLDRHATDRLSPRHIPHTHTSR